MVLRCARLRLRLICVKGTNRTALSLHNPSYRTPSNFDVQGANADKKQQPVL